MKKLINGWLVLFVAILVGCAAAVPPGVGVWDLMMSTPFGDQEVELTLNEDGSGLMSAGQLGESPFAGAMFEGNEVSFEADIDAGGMVISLNFSGTVEDDSLSGEFDTDFGPLEVTGTRQ